MLSFLLASRKVKRANSTVLRENLECQFSLLDRLVASEVLSEEEVSAIESERTPYDQNDRLLYILRQRTEDQLKLFLDALNETKQSHLVPYYDSNNGEI